MSEQTVRVEHVDYGIRIPRGDVQVVLLDATPVPVELQRQIDAICDLFSAPKRHETEDHER